MEEVCLRNGYFKQIHRRDHRLYRNQQQQLHFQEAAHLAPDFVQSSYAKEAVHFPDDGTANAKIMTQFHRHKAIRQGASFNKADCYEPKSGDNRTTSVKTSLGDLHASSVVVARGYLDVDFPQKCHLIAAATYFSGPPRLLQQSATPVTIFISLHAMTLALTTIFRPHGIPWYSYRETAA
jgi:glycine/D-amino acid oxidase-like deaminating enzyme